jgi:maltose alpha-D-glucosyltransferase/alpha-amylase
MSQFQDQLQQTSPRAEADPRDPLWFKDAIIYQLHVKAFADANNDGIGDFAGLIDKLDYVEQLGATAIWLLPFYPSPLRDDGYDIAEYTAVNPSYGEMADVQRFVEEAHKRGLRVITELVINHTSDQHPWFQRARHAPAGSPERDFYVWSDDDAKYAGTRIIFLDTEKSNWTWDPVAKAYFWHRFYAHQPDLNFDNPEVLEEIKKVLHFWLQSGVDGLRLDAVPYLIEREGTNNENLPETHEVLRKIRAEVDREYPDKMLLAEANQWPEDTAPYFGEGDECHMAFHFPLMPRMYMALAEEDRHPITDIMRQTPDIPENCQWAVFLRNHDELTLEMVTDRERDYLWQTYAYETRARINLGIRRRLAPLLDNDRRKIELLNSLLMSMPGTPVVYYGDEIGMGDNIYLGDRDGVRTPMQWSADRNGGFSRTMPQKLYLPLIMDPVYGYEAVNVEAQQAAPASLLNWMRRLITVRKAWTAFGRGSFELLYPRNRKVLAYLRRFEGELILCVVNLSRSAQAVELDLHELSGRVPVELLSRSPFPPIGELPYLLTLAPYGFYWFSLEEEASAPSWHIHTQPALPEFQTIVASEGWEGMLGGVSRRTLEAEVLPAYLAHQRWFAHVGGARRKLSARLTDWATLPSGAKDYLLAEVAVSGGEDPADSYFVPLAVTWSEEALVAGSPLLSYALAKTRRGPKVGGLHEAVVEDDFVRALAGALRDGRELPGGEGGVLRFCGTAALAELPSVQPDVLAEGEVRRLGGEQSNTTVLVGQELILKLYRRLQQGVQPEIEVARFLTEEAHFPNTPALLGWAERTDPDGAATTALMVAFAHVRNQGDAWEFTLNELDRLLDEAVLLGGTADQEVDPLLPSVARAELLGRRTAEMHLALASPTDDPAFAAEPVETADLEAWAEAVHRQVERGLRALGTGLAELSDADAELAHRLTNARERLFARVASIAAEAPAGMKTRLHGDYHLGQVLVSGEDFQIIDFEGEPRRSLAERRQKSSPWRDVAGMLRSYDYAAWSAVDHLYLDGKSSDVALAALEEWRRRSTAAFLAGYRAAMAEAPQPAPAGGAAADAAGAERLLELFLIEKATYELEYEAAHRPKWLHVPLRGALSLLERIQEASS